MVPVIAGLANRRSLLKAHPLSQVLISMPGVRIRTGARILIEVGDGSSFPSAAPSPNSDGFTATPYVPGPLPSPTPNAKPADVCGKGPEAAAVTSFTRYTLRTAAQIDPDPDKALASLNTALPLDPSVGTRFCTAVNGILEPHEKDGFTITLATGGHPSGLAPARTGDGGSGAPSGRHAHRRPRRRALRLAPGEGLLLYTDGLSEARDESGTFHDPAAWLTGRRIPTTGPLLNMAVDDIRTFSRGTNSDDMACSPHKQRDLNRPEGYTGPP